jgi:hypothetical protein
MLCSLLYLPLYLHLLLLCHALLRRQMLEFIVLIPRTSLWGPLPSASIVLRNFMNRLDHRSILYVYTILSANGHSAFVHEFDHLLTDYGHLENLRNRWSFLSVFIQKGTYQVL